MGMGPAAPRRRRRAKAAWFLVPILLLGVLGLLLATFWTGSRPPSGSPPPPPPVSASPPRPPAGTPRPPTGSPAPKPTGSATDDLAAQFQAFTEKCLQTTRTFLRAQVIYDSRMEMALDESKTVTAVVTLNRSAAPREVLPGRPGATARPILATCEVQARLRADPEDFGVDPDTWASRTLLEGQDARWTWLVRPKRGGSHTIVLELQPVVKITDENTKQTSTQSFTTESFESTVRVKVPPDVGASSFFSRIAGVFNDAGAAGQALLGLLVTAAALLGWLTKGRKWWRGRRGGPVPSDPPAADPADEAGGHHDRAGR